MREVQPTAAGHQELAAGRGHRVEHGNLRAALRQYLRRHQPGGAGADDGDVRFWRIRHGRGLRHSGTRVFAWTRNPEIVARDSGSGPSDHPGMTPYNYTPARAAAWLTYLLVCWNAFSSALAVDMSAISAKCVAIASGVQSALARLTPSVSITLITAKEPAPAPMIVRVGASPPSR